MASTFTRSHVERLFSIPSRHSALLASLLAVRVVVPVAAKLATRCQTILINILGRGFLRLTYFLACLVSFVWIGAVLAISVEHLRNDRQYVHCDGPTALHHLLELFRAFIVLLRPVIRDLMDAVFYQSAAFPQGLKYSRDCLQHRDSFVAGALNEIHGRILQLLTAKLISEHPEIEETLRGTLGELVRDAAVHEVSEGLGAVLRQTQEPTATG
jgi:hypothetical protein